MEAAFRKFRFSFVRGKAREGFERIARGEYVGISIVEIKRKLGELGLVNDHAAEILLSE